MLGLRILHQHRFSTVPHLVVCHHRQAVVVGEDLFAHHTRLQALRYQVPNWRSQKMTALLPSKPRIHRIILLRGLINDKLRLTLLHSATALRTPGLSVGEWWQSHKDARRQAKGHWIKLARNPVVCCGSYKESEKVTWA